MSHLVLSCVSADWSLQFGLGSSAPVQEFNHVFDGSLKLVWSDNTSNGTSPSPAEAVMNQIRSEVVRANGQQLLDVSLGRPSASAKRPTERDSDVP